MSGMCLNLSSNSATYAGNGTHRFSQGRRMRRGTDVAVVLAELDDRHRREHPLGAGHEPGVLQREQRAPHEQEVAARLDGEEATPWHVHAVCLGDEAHCGAGDRLELARIR